MVHFQQAQHFHRCLELAKQAASQDEVPVGALVLNPNGAIISEAYNLREANKDPTAHAEVLALREAARIHGHWNLTGHSLVSTLEPCPMCAGAIQQARISTLIYGASDPKGGAISRGINILANKELNHRVLIQQLDANLQSEAGKLMSEFFKKKR